MNPAHPFLEMGARIGNVLAAAGITTVDELTSRTREDLLRANNLGPTTLARIVGFLSQRGLLLARFVAEPTAPVPEWLITYEARAKVAGFKVERCRPDQSGGWWLSVTMAGCTISLFGALQFILGVSAQDMDPRELMARAQVLIDALEIVAPEITEKFTAKREAA